MATGRDDLILQQRAETSRGRAADRLRRRTAAAAKDVSMEPCGKINLFSNEAARQGGLRGRPASRKTWPPFQGFDDLRVDWIRGCAYTGKRPNRQAVGP